MTPPYILFELANAHGGSKERLLETISRIKSFQYQPKGIKLQVFKPSLIALPDFQWFRTYEELFQEPEVWADIIEVATCCGEVWLDVFDAYGVEILKANRASIAGLKLQASVLDNLEVLEALDNEGVSQITLIINISGYELSRISEYQDKFQKLRPRSLVFQVGFQAYPTAVADTGLQKIPVLRAAFPTVPLAFADHAPGGSPFALRVPVLAAYAGCSYIEKHFCLNRRDARFDFQSALEPVEMEEMLESLREMDAATSGPFVGVAEAEYLRKSYQAPIARHALPAGSLVGKSDLAFRRTNQSGLTWPEIEAAQSRFSVLTSPAQKHAAFSAAGFKPARIGVIVACRMKSSRLKNKAILPVHGVPSVERCLQNCLRFPHVNEVILATSTLEEDTVLGNHTLGGRVKFWRGDPEDVIGRYLGACKNFGIDVVIRVTADCPVVSPEIIARLLNEHFSAGADYTAPVDCAVGSSGEVYNTEALCRVITLLGKAECSEYMTWYLRNNPDIFKINLVRLPPDLKRNYRLTLDYPEDLEMFNKLFSRLDQRGQEPSLPNVFSILDSEPDIPALNGHLTLRYRTDQQLIEKLNRVTRIPATKQND